MAENAGGAEGQGEEKPQKKKLDPQVLLMLLNTVALLAAVGVAVKTKLLYQKPPIVESEEIKKKEEEVKKPDQPEDRVIVVFDQMLINLAMTSEKAHYLTAAWSIECKNNQVGAIAKELKAKLIDSMISTLGRRQLTEVSTVQGKYLLKAALIRDFNKILDTPDGVTDIFFSTYILQ